MYSFARAAPRSTKTPERQTMTFAVTAVSPSIQSLRPSRLHRQQYCSCCDAGPTRESEKKKVISSASGDRKFSLPIRLLTAGKLVVVSQTEEKKKRDRDDVIVLRWLAGGADAAARTGRQASERAIEGGREGWTEAVKTGPGRQSEGPVDQQQ